MPRDRSEFDDLAPLIKLIRAHPPFDRETELVVTRKARKGDKRAQEKLVVHNLSLVISVARKFMGRGVRLEDLVQEGNYGLLKAIEHFDPEKGNRFSTYAVWWIRARWRTWASSGASRASASGRWRRARANSSAATSRSSTRRHKAKGADATTKGAHPTRDGAFRVFNAVGCGLLGTLVGADGKVTDVTVTGKASPAALKAIQRFIAGCVYAPALRDGKPVTVRWRGELDFTRAPGPR